MCSKEWVRKKSPRFYQEIFVPLWVLRISTLVIRSLIFENPEALPTISVDEPTMSMLFGINNSPFYGKDGKFVTSRHIRERLMKETEKNLALKLRTVKMPIAFWFMAAAFCIWEF